MLTKMPWWIFNGSGLKIIAPGLFLKLSVKNDVNFLEGTVWLLNQNKNKNYDHIFSSCSLISLFKRWLAPQYVWP